MHRWFYLRVVYCGSVHLKRARISHEPSLGLYERVSRARPQGSSQGLR